MTSARPFAEGFYGFVPRTSYPGAPFDVDVVPSLAHPDGGKPFGKVESAVVERRYDDPLRCPVTPQAVPDEQLRRNCAAVVPYVSVFARKQLSAACVPVCVLVPAVPCIPGYTSCASACVLVRAAPCISGWIPLCAAVRVPAFVPARIPRLSLRLLSRRTGARQCVRPMPATPAARTNGAWVHTATVRCGTARPALRVRKARWPRGAPRRCGSAAGSRAARRHRGSVRTRGGVERQRMKGRRDQRRRGRSSSEALKSRIVRAGCWKAAVPSSGLASPANAGRYMASRSIRCSRPEESTTIFSGLRPPCAQSSDVSLAARRSNAAASCPEPCCVFCRGRLCDGFVERRAFDPVAQYDVDPNPAPGRVVEVQLLRRRPFAVNLRQVARRMHVAPQRADMPFVADTEDDGAVAYGVAHAAPAVTAYLHAAQGFRQSVGVGQCREVLSQREHGLLVVLLPGSGTEDSGLQGGAAKAEPPPGLGEGSLLPAAPVESASFTSSPGRS